MVLLAFLREPLRHPDRPGSRGFALAVAGIVLWPLCVGTIYFLSTLQPAVFAWHGRVFAASLVSVAWLLLAIDFTDRWPLDRRLLAPLAAYLLLEIVVLATNPLHQLAAGPEATIVDGVLDPDQQAWFWIQAVINYVLIGFATAVFALDAWRSSGLRRTQSAVLAVAVVPPLAANAVTIFGLVETAHDLTPLGLVGSGLLLSWALYRVDFLNVVPIARETAMGEMRDAVVTLDHGNRVVDCNAAAREWFDVEEGYLGTSAEEFFTTLPPKTVERFESETDVDTRVSVDVDGERRHASVSVTPVVGASGEFAGRVLVLRDVTSMKRREEALKARETELDLLRQVLSRTLRHNIRTELGVIRGNADLLAETVEDPAAIERIRIIREAEENLLEISEKARSVEQFVDTDVGPSPTTSGASSTTSSTTSESDTRRPNSTSRASTPVGSVRAHSYGRRSKTSSKTPPGTPTATIPGSRFRLPTGPRTPPSSSRTTARAFPPRNWRPSKPGPKRR